MSVRRHSHGRVKVEDSGRVGAVVRAVEKVSLRPLRQRARRLSQGSQTDRARDQGVGATSVVRCDGKSNRSHSVICEDEEVGVSLADGA